MELKDLKDFNISIVCSTIEEATSFMGIIKQNIPDRNWKINDNAFSSINNKQIFVIETEINRIKRGFIDLDLDLFQNLFIKNGEIVINKNPTPPTSEGIEQLKKDWEQRRYEIAKEITVSQFMKDKITENTFKVATNVADALIEQLKAKEEYGEK